MKSNNKTVVIGADHAGVSLKAHLVPLLKKEGWLVKDAGSFNSKKLDDYPDIAVKVARMIAKHPGMRAILICGTGTGMVMAANKILGVRAAMCYDQYSARMARHDNDANILTLRARFFSKAKAWQVTSAWLETPFSGLARHSRRIQKLTKLDNARG